MAQFPWRPFLEQFSREVLADNDARAFLSPDVIAAGWLGFPAASDEEVQALERRIHAQLPASYRSFLRTTNGWRTAGAFVYDLLPTSGVAWFCDLHQDWIDAWNEGAAQYGGQSPVSDEDYFVYGPKQDCCRFRDEYWQATLALSGTGDSAIYLLNPKVVGRDGEWEAWFFANWLPGATRYRSFAEMMQAELDRFVALRNSRQNPPAA